MVSKLITSLVCLFALSALSGCGGGSSSPTANPYAGSFVGTYTITETGQNGTVNYTVDNAGNLSGVINVSSSRTDTLSGTITPGGAIAITLKSPTGTVDNSAAGTVSSPTSVPFTGVLVTSGHQTIHFSLTKSGIVAGNSVYVGNYTGSYQVVETSQTGTVDLAIDVNGNITGTVTITGGATDNATGTVSNSGNISLTLKDTSGTLVDSDIGTIGPATPNPIPVSMKNSANNTVNLSLTKLTPP